jgi:hypothetical protein
VVTVDHDGDVHALSRTCQDTTCAFAMHRFDRQTDTWSIAVDGGPGGNQSLVATGRNDHALAIWNGTSGLGSWRLDPATGEWLPVSTAGIVVWDLSQMRVAIGSTGAAALFWPDQGATRLFVSVFDPAARAWMTPLAVQTPEAKLLVNRHQVAIDDGGNVSIVWMEGDPQTPGSPLSLWTKRWACRP